MIGHQVVLVYRLDGGSQGLPHLRLDVALDVTTHEPDNVGLILITVGEEGSVFLGILHTQQTGLDQSAPNAYHTDIDTLVGSLVDDIVQVVPIAIDTLLVNVLEVPSVNVRHLSVDVIGWYSVNGLYLHDVIAGLGARVQIPFSLGPVESFG